jgi:allantoinase
MELRTHDRYDYAPLRGRADYSWPAGRRLAVYFALNLEHFSYGEGLGAELAPGGPHPDILNYAWRDYGNRVGAWYMLDAFDALRLPMAALANSAMYDYAPELVAACRARGDEIVGHGRTNAERQGVLGEADERALIAEATARLTEAEGRAPEGWLGPWISHSHVTPDLLAEAGYRYLLDWCMDDQPIWFRCRGGRRILSVPYPQEVNDIPQIAGRKIGGDAFADIIVDQFDEMLELSQERPLVMGVALHAYLVGQPHRLRH